MNWKYEPNRFVIIIVNEKINMECLYRFYLYRTHIWNFSIEVHGQILFNLGTDDEL